MISHETRYAKTIDGVYIAYQVRGEGPVDLVHAMGFAANFEVELEEPRLARLYDKIATLARLILFDKRGSGLSDRKQTPDLDMRADDLRAVMDAIGSKAAVLFGSSEGGALAAFFAAAHPERVLGLILWGAQAKIAWAPDYTIGMEHDAFLIDREQIEHRWGTLGFARTWIADEAPSLVGDDDFARWWAKAMRYAASPSEALAFEDVWYAMDVRSVLGSVQAPTLLLHRGPGDEVSRDLADRIPGARFVHLPGVDYHLAAGDQDAVVSEVESFLRSLREEQATIDRVLSTVMFTDIVGSTERAAAIGDHGWRDLRDRHDQTIRALIGRYRGHEIDHTGDGVLATFDGPARAVRCGVAISDAVRRLDLEVRVGIHTGEIEIVPDGVRGIAVHIGARVMSAAGASQVLVSQTVKDLVAGSGLTFEDVGEHELKGVPDRWRLYRVVN